MLLRLNRFYPLAMKYLNKYAFFILINCYLFATSININCFMGLNQNSILIRNKKEFFSPWIY